MEFGITRVEVVLGVVGGPEQFVGRDNLGDKPGYWHESRALMLVRGQDRTGRNDFEWGHARVADATQAISPAGWAVRDGRAC